MDHMTKEVLLSLSAAVVFSLVHLEARKLYGFSEKYRQRILSLSGGVAAAFVFLDLLPIIQQAGYHFEVLFGESAFARMLLERAVFGVAFLGFLSFLTVEFFAVRSRSRQADASSASMESVPAPRSTFYAHIGLTALLSLVIAYTLRFEVRAGSLVLLFYTLALSLHFLVADRTLEDHYQRRYVRYGRYILALMPPTGWVLSMLFPERRSEAYVALAFIAGAVLFNVVKDEIPRVGRGRPAYFITGAVVYSVLILLTTWLH